MGKEKKKNLVSEAIEEINDDEELLHLFDELGTSMELLRRTKIKSKEDKKSRLQSSIKKDENRISEIRSILSKKNCEWRLISGMRSS